MRRRGRAFDHQPHGLLGFFPREIFRCFLTLGDFGEQMLHVLVITLSDFRVTMKLFVQSALGLAEVLPPTRARIVSRKDGRGAMRAADAGIIAVVQGVIGHFMKLEVHPDFFTAPSGQGIHFDQVEFPIPFDEPRVGSRRSLVAPDPRDPCRIVCKDAGEWLELPQFTALVRLAGPKCRPVLHGLLIRRHQRFHLNDLRRLQVIMRNNAIANIHRFRKEKIRIQIKKRRSRVEAMHHVYQRHVFCPKAAGKHNPLRIGRERVFQHVPGLLRLERITARFELLVRSGAQQVSASSFTLPTPRPFPQEF